MGRNLRFRRLRLRNWKNFLRVDVVLQDRLFLVGANASGKSNFLDAFRFLRDIALSGSGFREAVLHPRRGVQAFGIGGHLVPALVRGGEAAHDGGRPAEPGSWRGIETPATGSPACASTSRSRGRAQDICQVTVVPSDHPNLRGADAVFGGAESSP